MNTQSKCELSEEQMLVDIAYIFKAVISRPLGRHFTDILVNSFSFYLNFLSYSVISAKYRLQDIRKRAFLCMVMWGMRIAVHYHSWTWKLGWFWLLWGLCCVHWGSKCNVLVASTGTMYEKVLLWWRAAEGYGIVHGRLIKSKPLTWIAYPSSKP